MVSRYIAEQRVPAVSHVRFQLQFASFCCVGSIGNRLCEMLNNTLRPPSARDFLPKFQVPVPNKNLVAKGNGIALSAKSKTRTFF